MTARLQVVTPVFPPAVGGIESLTVGLVDRWPGPVQVLTLEEPGWREFDEAAGYEVRRVSNVPRGGRRSLARLTCSVAGHTRRFRPDIVLNMHVRCGPAASLSRLLSGAAWLQYYHAKEVPTWAAATRFCARRADGGIAVSRFTRSLVEAVAPPWTPPSVIPPGIPAPRRSVAARRQRPTLLTVARISDPYKGHDVLLEALPMIRQAVPDVLWTVVGVGDRLDWLRTEVAGRGLADHTEILGLVDDATRDELFATSHVFALPSRTSGDGRAGEGFGIVYAEAAAAGLPIVAGDNGGVVDAVRHGVSGLLVDPADARQVADAVIALLSDEDRNGRMALAAREWSRQFEWDTVARTFEKTALEALRRRRGGAAVPASQDGWVA